MPLEIFVRAIDKTPIACYNGKCSVKKLNLTAATIKRCRCTRNERKTMRLIHSPRRFTPMIAATLALAASQAHADITTPDAYGYRAYDVTAILNLSKFEDISQSANLILTGDDKVAKNLALGFTFNIYGQNFTQVGVSDNGLMQFSDFPTAQFTKIKI